MLAPSPAQRRTLGAFLRRHRDRITPALAGLPEGTRRRAPGLRREEVAQLCGMSATWYSWIEQGRDVSVSPQALARLAEALRLSRAERTYLFDLAGKRDPLGDAAASDAAAPAAAIAALGAMTGPAYLLDRCWQALAWNAPAERLFAGWLDRPATEPAERNLLRYIFLEPSARDLICDWEERARRVLAEFRAEHSRDLDDPPLRALVEELARRSPVFARAWEAHDVLDRAGGLRTFRHPREGFLRYEQVGFTLAGRPDLKLVMLVPPAAPAA